MNWGRRTTTRFWIDFGLGMADVNIAYPMLDAVHTMVPYPDFRSMLDGSRYLR